VDSPASLKSVIAAGWLFGLPDSLPELVNRFSHEFQICHANS
jgi:hypothetical protein